MNASSETTINSHSRARTILTAAAVLMLAAGIGLGLYALFASLGVWFGMWTFREGFDMLRKVNSGADWLAWIGLTVTVLVFFFSRRVAPEKTARLTAFAAIGTLAAILAYVVPESYRAADGTPAIHDIATDTVNPLDYVAIAPLRADAANTMVYGGSPNMTHERLAQLQTEAYPDIVPQIYQEPKEVIFARALAVVGDLGWDLVAQVPEEGRIEATDTTFWFRFKDDVIIVITESADGTVLNARSLSRVGGSDIGKNAARLRDFFARMR